eukprot:m.346861 g.346861  ORF g.346861 m.346861 type:complete len:412 (+) comp30528_c0_seq1:2-1237(+)
MCFISSLSNVRCRMARCGWRRACLPALCLVMLWWLWRTKTVTPAIQLATAIEIPLSDIELVVGRHFPRYKVTEHKRLAGGVINAVFLLRLETKEKPLQVVLKFSNPSWRGDCKLRNEIAAMRLVQRYTKLPIPKVLAASDEPETNGVGLGYVILSFERGAKLKDVLPSLTEQQKRHVFRQWSEFSAELKKIELPSFGSFSTLVGTFTDLEGNAHIEEEVSITALSGNGLCSHLGPFKNYAEYAVAKATQFIPLLPQHSDNVKDIVTKWANAVLIKDRGVIEQPVLIHHDISVRNILVHVDSSGNASLTSFLDWEFAMAAPFDEEAGFPFMLEHMTDADRDIFWEEWQSMQLPKPKPDDDVTQNLRMYESLIRLAHCHMWGLDQVELENTVANAKKMVWDLCVKKGGCAKDE